MTVTLDIGEVLEQLVQEKLGGAEYPWKIRINERERKLPVVIRTEADDFGLAALHVDKDSYGRTVLVLDMGHRIVEDKLATTAELDEEGEIQND